MKCRWVLFTLKYKPNGTLERYKASLVNKGYTWAYELIIMILFAPVANMNIVTLLSSRTNLDWSLQLFDIQNCLLAWRLRERGMEAPLRFNDGFKTSKVCIFHKTLYALK